MYTSNLKIKEGFTSYATTPLGGEYKMFIEESKDGPMDLFATAYNGCVSMCAKGYFFRAYELVDYDNRKIVVNVHVDRTEEQLATGDRQGVLDNIKLRCKVSHLLSSDLEIQYNILPLK